MSEEAFLLGFDFKLFSDLGIKVPIYGPVNGHFCLVGSSGSGKSTALLFWLYKLRNHPVKLYIADFKRSGEFYGITDNHAEFEDCYELIQNYYTEFLNTPEGGDGYTRILLVDEIAGMLSHLSMTKDGKQKADEIRNIMSSILSMGRSRKCFIFLSMQRYTATIFPASSGAADNFFVCCGLGRLTVDGRRGLFADEHFEGEDELLYGQGKGIILIDGQNIRSIIIPRVSKQKILRILQNDFVKGRAAAKPPAP